jgi:hypothetical protein
MMNQEERRVLQLIATGVISAGEGEQLLEAMRVGADTAGEASVRGSQVVPSAGGPVVFPPAPAWASQWLAIVLVGTVLLFTGLGFSFLVIGGPISAWWLLLTLPLLLLGAVVVLLGYFCSSQRWLHMRIDSEGTRFKFSLPLPFSWLTGLFRFARMFEPRLAVITDDVLDELTYAAEGYFYVEVDEAAKGDYVQIYYS